MRIVIFWSAYLHATFQDLFSARQVRVSITAWNSGLELQTPFSVGKHPILYYSESSKSRFYQDIHFTSLFNIVFSHHNIHITS